jgi:hypothetical protein
MFRLRLVILLEQIMHRAANDFYPGCPSVHAGLQPLQVPREFYSYGKLRIMKRWFS